MKAGDAKGWLTLAVVLVGAYLLYKFVKTGANVLQSTGEAIGGGLYTAINGDPNATLQSNFQAFLAAWKAAGSPATGSPAEIALRTQYSIPLPPATVVASGNSGS